MTSSRFKTLSDTEDFESEPLFIRQVGDFVHAPKSLVMRRSGKFNSIPIERGSSVAVHWLPGKVMQRVLEDGTKPCPEAGAGTGAVAGQGNPSLGDRISRQVVGVGPPILSGNRRRVCTHGREQVSDCLRVGVQEICVVS